MKPIWSHKNTYVKFDTGVVPKSQFQSCSVYILEWFSNMSLNQQQISSAPSINASLSVLKSYFPAWSLFNKTLSPPLTRVEPPKVPVRTKKLKANGILRNNDNDVASNVQVRIKLKQPLQVRSRSKSTWLAANIDKLSDLWLSSRMFIWEISCWNH